MYQTSVKRAGKFEAKLNLYLIKESQNQCTHIERLERNGRSWKSEKPVEIVKELQAEGNGWGESSTDWEIYFNFLGLLSGGPARSQICY